MYTKTKRTGRLVDDDVCFCCTGHGAADPGCVGARLRASRAQLSLVVRAVGGLSTGGGAQRRLLIHRQRLVQVILTTVRG